MVDAPINDVHQLEEFRVYLKPGAVKIRLKIFLSLKTNFLWLGPTLVVGQDHNNTIGMCKMLLFDFAISLLQEIGTSQKAKCPLTLLFCGQRQD